MNSYWYGIINIFCLFYNPRFPHPPSKAPLTFNQAIMAAWEMMCINLLSNVFQALVQKNAL